MTNTSDHAIEQRLRRKAASLGMRVEKSRTRNTHLNDHGGYQLVESYRKYVVAGVDYDLTLGELDTSIELLKDHVIA